MSHFLMNSFSLRSIAPSRNLLAIAVFLLALTSNAQTPISPRFQLNFAAADAEKNHITFRQEGESKDVFDLVILQKGEEIFRFRDIDRMSESLYTFSLVNDKFEALAGLNRQATLTSTSNFGTEILAAYENKQTAYIGILECSTKNGATSRMQVAQMFSEDDEAANEGLTDVKDK